MNASRPEIAPEIPPEIQNWFDARGWRVRRHQSDMLAKAREGRHALLVADTGAGKTLAGFLPTLCDFAPSVGTLPEEGLHTLYVSPLKALAHDVKRNLLTPIEEIGLPITVETRSGDTSSDRKKRQRSAPPHVLLTTRRSPRAGLGAVATTCARYAAGGLVRNARRSAELSGMARAPICGWHR